MARRIALLVAGIFVAVLAYAQTPNLLRYFGPATGILVGVANSPVTRAATASDLATLSISGTPTVGHCAQFASATTFSDAGAVCGSGSSIPGGSDTQVQFNNVGSLAGASNLLYNNSTGQVTSTAKFQAQSATGVALAVVETATTSTNAATIQAGTTSGNSRGLFLSGGTTSADYAQLIKNASQSTTFYELFGDGGAVYGAATGGDQGAGTANAQALYVNGLQIPRQTFWDGSCNSSGCTANTNVGVSSISRIGTGQYTVNFSTAYTAATSVACVATGYGSGATTLASVASTVAANVTIDVTTGGAAADNGFTLICTGT